jgi:hypothetical protein
MLIMFGFVLCWQESVRNLLGNVGSVVKLLHVSDEKQQVL